MKKVLMIVLGFLILIVSTGCNESSGSKVSVRNKSSDIFSGTEKNLELEWDDEKKAVLLINKTTNKIWSNVSTDPSADGNSNLMSPLNIQVSNSENLSWEIVNGYDAAIINGKVSCKKSDNGLLVTYYFQSYGISIPVKYEINNGYMRTSIVTEQIIEKNKYKLVSVSLSPNLCSVKNTENNGSYLFLPVGSGALMSTKENANGARKYSGDIYGYEYAGLRSDYLTDEEKIRMPVFGAKDENDALFCIIEEPVGYAELNADAGDSSTGISRVYPKFYMRGYDVLPITEMTLYLGGSEYRIAADDMSDANPSIIYYPMSGGNSDYNAMAKLYREYLQTQNQAFKSETISPSFSLTLYGGTQITTTTLGIPHKSTRVLTSYDSATKIVGDLSDNSEFLPNVRMVGFGSSGVIPGKLAGGFSLSNIYGSNSDRKRLMQLCDDKNILLSWDFDLVRFSKTGNGFSSLFSAAKTASSRTAIVYPIAVPDRTNITAKGYHLLKRNKTSTAVNKLTKYLSKQNIDAVSLFTLTEITYSDFSSKDFYSKNSIENSVNNSIKVFHDNDIKVIGGSNIFAAVNSDAVYDVPIDSGEYNDFSETIPFYQMVLHGYKNLYSTTLNSAGDFQRNIVRALSTGTNLSFSFIDSYDTKFQTSDTIYLDTGSAKLYSLVYNRKKEKVETVISKYKDIYSEVSSSEILSFRWENSDISVTVFSNGKTLYANHSQNNVKISDISLEPYSVKLV